MINKKRFIAIILTFVLILSLSACGSASSTPEEVDTQEDITPEGVYTQASEKTSALKSVDMTMDMDMDLQISSQSIKATTKSDVKVKGNATDDMQMSMNMTMNILGNDQELSMYYKDGYYYTQSGDTKIKYAMDIAELQKSLESSTGLASQLKTEMFTELKSEQDGDNTILSYTGDGSKLTDIVSSMMGSMQNLTGGTDLNMTIKSFSGTSTVNKDGYFTDGTMKMGITMNTSEGEITADINAKYVYNNPGQEVTVTIPDDLGDYQEIDPATLNQAS